jgi:hypothetical protein
VLLQKNLDKLQHLEGYHPRRASGNEDATAKAFIAHERPSEARCMIGAYSVVDHGQERSSLSDGVLRAEQAQGLS